MYDEDARTGIYGDVGEPGQSVIDILTDAGLARAHVLPGPSPIEVFIASLIQSINSNDYVTCTTPAAGTFAGGCQTGVLT